MLALFDIESWLRNGGLMLLAVIVFAESGLLVGFFLPGDSLLFIAGFLASNAGGGHLPGLIPTACVAMAAAIVGDQVGYLFGKRVGPALFDRPESRFFHPRHAAKASDFFERHGSRAIVLARFVPIVRTFAPILAGVGHMRYRTFVTYNVVGGVVWGAGITTLGYYMGEIELVKANLEIAVLAIVAISLIPVAIEMLRHRRATSAS